MTKKKEIKDFILSNKAHLLLLIFGNLILICGCFQNSLWFDEAYTVGLMENDFIDMLKWSASDVHPHLYYVMLKLFTLVFGKSLFAMRIFSVLGIVFLALLGLTHIKKDFGRKIGFLFSFCVLFSSSTMVYALQIRMYSWAAFFVAITAIFAYRLYWDFHNRKYQILFIIFSVLAAYTHYFALFSVMAINLVLLFAIKNTKENLTRWILNGLCQIILYIPGGLVFLHQIGIGGASWITVEWPDVVFDLISFHLLGGTLRSFLPWKETKYLIVGGICLALYLVAGILVFRYIKSNPKKPKQIAVKGAISVYFSVILFSLCVSLFRPIYYIRYTVVICSFLFFAVAVLISSFLKRILKIIAIIVLTLIFTFQTINYYKIIYDPSENDVKETLDEIIQEDDIFLIDNIDAYVITV